MSVHVGGAKRLEPPLSHSEPPQSHRVSDRDEDPAAGQLQSDVREDEDGGRAAAAREHRSPGERSTPAAVL